MVWDLDARYLKGHRLSHNISLKMQTQGFKDSFCSEEFKPKDPKLAPSYDNAAELAKNEDRKDNKKRFQGKKQKHTREWKKQTPTTSINVIKTSSKKNTCISYIIIVIKKVTIWNPAQNPPKTNVSFGKLCFNYW